MPASQERLERLMNSSQEGAVFTRAETASSPAPSTFEQARLASAPERVAARQAYLEQQSRLGENREQVAEFNREARLTGTQEQRRQVEQAARSRETTATRSVLARRLIEDGGYPEAIFEAENIDRLARGKTERGRSWVAAKVVSIREGLSQAAGGFWVTLRQVWRGFWYKIRR